MRTLLVLSLAAFAAACTASQFARTETALADVLITDQEEQKLGLQVGDELDKQGVKYSGDAQVNGYVRGLVGKIAPFAAKDRAVTWDVKVIEDAKTVNAFATPGGHVYVYSGLLLTAANEAEVVGVLSHEMGHVVGRHGARQLVNTYGLQAVSGLVLGKDPNLLAQLGTNLVSKGALLANSRADEDEADGYAVHYASAAGYVPNGIAQFFEKLLKTEGSSPRILTWLSTHPATADRITHVNQVIAADHLGGNDVGADRLVAIQRALSNAPAAAAPAPTQPAATQPAATPPPAAPSGPPVRKR